MDISHVKEGEVTIVTMKGRLDAEACPDADKAIKTVLKGDR
jgi:hypothetical protein